MKSASVTSLVVSNLRRFGSRTAVLALVPIAFSSFVSADVIQLKNGARLDGRVVGENADSLTVEISGGTIKLANADVEWMVRGTADEIDAKRRIAGHYEKARQLFDRGDFIPAAWEYQKALELDHKNPHLANNLGTCYAKAGNLDKAVAAYQDALRRDPRHVVARLNLVASLIAQGKNADAVEAASQGVNFSPLDPRLRSALGLALFKSKDFAKAGASFREALAFSKRPDADALNDVGAAHAMLGRPGLAARFFRKALRVQPGHAIARRNLEKVAS